MFHLCSWLVDLPPSNVSPWGNQWFISPQYTTPFSLPCWWWSTHSKVGSYLHRGENNSSYPFISGHLGWKNQPKKKCPWTFYLPLVFFLKPQWTAGTLLWPQVRGFLFSDWGLACENFCFDNWGLKETIFPEKNIPGWWLSQPNWKISASQTLGIISRRCGVIRLVFFFQGPTVLCFSCVKLRQMVETQATTLRMDVPGLLGSMVITDRINGLCHLLKKWIAYLGWKKNPTGSYLTFDPHHFHPSGDIHLVRT